MTSSPYTRRLSRDATRKWRENLKAKGLVEVPQLGVWVTPENLAKIKAYAKGLDGRSKS